jgi:hypothetical protein
MQKQAPAIPTSNGFESDATLQEPAQAAENSADKVRRQV